MITLVLVIKTIIMIMIILIISIVVTVITILVIMLVRTTKIIFIIRLATIIARPSSDSRSWNFGMPSRAPKLRRSSFARPVLGGFGA